MTQRNQWFGVDPADRFRAMVDTSGVCHVWIGARGPSGYGKFHFAGGMQLAHRVAWAMEHGPIPAGMAVLHHCDNPPCVRLAHLFMGTHRDNMQDMLAKGRAGVWVHPERLERGETRYNARLTDEAVRHVRASRESGVVLASRYGVSRNTIWRVRHGLGWVHVEACGAAVPA